VSLLGPVACRRAYYYCGRCGHGTAPWDQAVGLTPQAFTPATERLVSLAGLLRDSFAEAAEKLTPELAGLRVAETNVQRTTEAVARRRASPAASRASRSWSRSRAAMPSGSCSAPSTGDGPRARHPPIVATSKVLQAFLRNLRQRYFGRPPWLLVDEAPVMTAPAFEAWRTTWGPLLCLARQCPDRNAVDQLFKDLKRLIAANRQFRTLGEEAEYAEHWLLALTARQALPKASVRLDAFGSRAFGTPLAAYVRSPASRHRAAGSSLHLPAGCRAPSATSRPDHRRRPTGGTRLARSLVGVH
jgi:hypothetical protein